MMARDNVELYRRVVDDLNRGDLEASLAFIPRTPRLTASRHVPHRGRDGQGGLGALRHDGVPGAVGRDGPTGAIAVGKPHQRQE
jgi:hypothetical protein